MIALVTQLELAKAALKTFRAAFGKHIPDRPYSTNPKEGASKDAELSSEFDRPGHVSNAEGHPAKGAVDPARSGARGVVASPIGGRGGEGSSQSPRVSHGLHMKVVGGKLICQRKSRIVE